jgi:hypothetical protein
VTGAPDPFINVRFDYAFMKLADSVSKQSGLDVKFEYSWPWTAQTYNADNNKLPTNSILSIGYPATETALGTAPVLYGLQAPVYSEVYHPNIDTIATPDANFTRGISRGAWLIKSSGKFWLESLNSSYAPEF